MEIIVTKSEIEKKQALEVRRRVFIEEQNVSEGLELDEFENIATHFVALDNGRPVGVGRLRLKKYYAKFERIAALKECRGKGVGQKIMSFMEDYAKLKFPSYLPAMHAQKSAISFYEKIGWEGIGDEFEEAGIVHKVLVLPPNDLESLRGLQILEDKDANKDIKQFLENEIIRHQKLL